MTLHLQATTTLHNGVQMPWVGKGVWQVAEGEEVINTVKTAIKAGYRAVDTAMIYRNEVGVGQAIKESGVPREELFITTKVWNKAQGYESTLEAFEKSMDRLDLEYLDLYLIHWPVVGKYKDTWRALEKLYADGRVRAIGVCNFKEHHLEDVMKECTVVPMVNQVELHPQFSQKPLRDFCKQHNIQIQAWSPLGMGKLLDNEVLKGIAAKHGKTVAQVILRWDLQHGIVTIPKSITPSRIVENTKLFDFELDEADMLAIDGLNTNVRMGPDPDTFDF